MLFDTEKILLELIFFIWSRIKPTAQGWQNFLSGGHKNAPKQKIWRAQKYVQKGLVGET